MIPLSLSVAAADPETFLQSIIILSSLSGLSLYCGIHARILYAIHCTFESKDT